MFKKIALAIICCLGCFLAVAHSQTNTAGEGQPTGALSCGKCHVCNNPSPQEPCLVDCPRTWMAGTTGHKLAPDSGPENVVLNELENLYEPVAFNHKIHAEMADIQPVNETNIHETLDLGDLK